jgi:hypothetical protein
MEAQEIQVPQAQTRQSGRGEGETREIEAGDLELLEAAAPEKIESLETPRAPEPEQTATHTPGVCRAESRAEEAGAFEASLTESLLDEDETQLAAIRELMVRACARGVWLTLGEIAEATEFGEASISAQLRHLRKPHHGGYHVEKRRRRPARTAAVLREMRDVRRGPVTWEYRVLPPV